MKRIFTLLAFLVVCTSAFSQATVTLECYSCEELSGRYCASCQDSEVNYFKGLLVRTPQGAFEINSPFSVLVRGSSVRLTDWQGDIVAFARRDTPYRNMEELMDVINGCNCQGGGSLTPGSVGTDELADGAVEWDKLSDAVQDSIQAGSSGGTASIFKEENSSTDATAGTTDNYHVGDLAVGDFSDKTIAADFHVYRADQAVLRLSDDGTVDSTTLAFIEFYRGANTSKLGDIGFLDNTDQHLHLRNNMSGGGISFATGGSVEKFVMLASGQWHWNLYGDSSYIISNPVHFIAADDNGFVGEVNISETKNPAVSSPTVASTTEIDLNDKDEGVFYIDLSSRVNTSISFLNPWNGGRYSLWVTGVAEDTITFPGNFVSKDGIAFSSRVADTDEVIDFWYDGINFVAPDTFWVASSLSPPFSPDDISSLTLWYDASQEAYSNGASVGTINDHSGNGFNTTQAAPGEQATFATSVVNGQPVFRFDGSDDNYSRVALSALDSGNDWTVVWVAAQDGADANGTVWATTDADDVPDTRVAGYADTRSNVNHTVVKTGVGPFLLTQGSEHTGGQFYVFTTTNDFTSLGGTMRAYVSTTETDTESWSFVSTSYSNLHFSLGAQQNDTLFLDGDIAEILIFSEVLSPTDRGEVIDYLETKYGL